MVVKSWYGLVSSEILTLLSPSSGSNSKRPETHASAVS